MDRFIANVAGWLGKLMLGAPLLALVAAALLDVGPEGRVRFTPFPLVLTAFDTLLATSVLQSVEVAAVVAISSLLAGLVLGGLLAGGRFWGRPILGGTIAGLAILPPAFLALGILGLATSSVPRPSTGLTVLGWAEPARFPLGWRWTTWLLAAFIPGAALVAEAVGRGLRNLHPSWAEAARLAGAGRLRFWLGIAWPRIRPGIARATRDVFILTLADPGPPLILGLRRTLGFQIVSGALGVDPFPRAAAASLMVLGLSLAAGVIAYRRGPSLRPGSRPVVPDLAATRSSPDVAGLSLRYVLLPAFLLVAWMPVAGLVRLALRVDADPDATPGTYALGRAWTLGAWDQAGPIVAVLRSVGAASAVVLMVTILARSLPLHPGRDGRRSPLPRRLGELTPPLVAGVGVLSLVRIAWLATAALGGMVHEPTLTVSSPSPAVRLDLRGWPGLLVVLGLILAHVPRRLGDAAEDLADRDGVQRRIEQARLLGVGRSRSLRLARAGGRGIPASTIVLWSVLAGVSVAPAILLGGPDADWGIGPWVVSHASGPGAARREAARLALGAIAVSLAALGAARRRARPMST